MGSGGGNQDKDRQRKEGTMIKARKLNILMLTGFFLLLAAANEANSQCPECPTPVFSAPGNYQKDPSWDLKWSESNPQTIARNAEVGISVMGGVTPYAWSVSGKGFSLDQSQTLVESNTLRADGTACGAATITVSDASGASVNGAVRCTDSGTWNTIEANTCAGGGTAYSNIIGNKRYVVILSHPSLVFVGCDPASVSACHAWYINYGMGYIPAAPKSYCKRGICGDDPSGGRWYTIPNPGCGSQGQTYGYAYSIEEWTCP